MCYVAYLLHQKIFFCKLSIKYTITFIYFGQQVFVLLLTFYVFVLSHFIIIYTFL
jgi:hypothetical protein